MNDDSHIDLVISETHGFIFAPFYEPLLTALCSVLRDLPEAWDRQQDLLYRARAVGCTAGRAQQGSPGQSEKKF